MSVRPAINRTFHDVLTEAIRDITEHGYDDPGRLQEWLRRLRFAAMADLPTDAEMRNRMQTAMDAVFHRTLSKTGALRYHPGVPRFTIERLAPSLRPELDKRVRASVDLIKLNRERAVEQSLQRLAGWVSSVPAGGSRAVDKPEVRESIAKPIRQLRYEERRVSIDQGHKLMSSINAVIAEQTQAIGAKWRSHYRDKSYNARPDHAERDSKIYLVRGSWAHEQGLVKPGPAGYTDQITMPGEEVFCFPSETSIDLFQDVEKAYRRWYEGDLVTLTIRSGRKLSATPNHPVLCEKGWVAIGTLKKGDRVFEIAEESVKTAKLDTDKTLTLIADLFDAIRARGFKEVRRGMKPQFHGDGTEQDIDVVSTAWPLRDNLVAPISQRFNELILACADSLRLAGRVVRKNLFGFLSPAHGSMSLGSSDVAMLIHGRSEGAIRGLGGLESVQHGFSGHAKRLGKLAGILSSLIAPAKLKRIRRNLLNSASAGPKVDPSLLVPMPDGHGGYTDLTRDAADGKPLLAKLVDVIDIDVRPWAGHVYNLQTESGWYVANSIITHNCRCYYTYLHALRDLPPEMLTEKGRRALEETRIRKP
ncbi:Hint domain-containing protein [Burkholderia cenocepacia]|uniref:Hint domain-containing protein n=1 Tax=Burkholderia cenocepacia TaxID=95486 RepID=UPI0009B53973|nr:Hint domain-containing protein [Burkholderia cenocepacia]